MSTDKEEDEDLTIPIASAEAIKPKFPYMEGLIKVLSALSMWPNSKETNSFLYHAKVWTTVFVCVTHSLTFGIKIKNEFGSMDSVTGLIDYLTVFISAIFRYIYVYVRADKHKELVSLIHGNFIHYPIIPNKKGTSLDIHYRLARKLILVYCTFTVSWVFQICTIPIVSYVWARAKLPPNSNETIPYPIPYDVYTPFDYQKQPANVLFYAYQFVGFMAFALIYVAVDSFWYMVILLTIGQFVLIHESLTSMTEILKKAEARDEPPRLSERQIRRVEDGLKRCIAHHQFIRKFVHLTDDICNPVILVDSMHAMVSIGFILLDLTISLSIGSWNRVMYSLEYFITSITHMFFFDWLGNELAQKEEELAGAIYDLPWYKLRTQKPAFLLMFMQTRRPFKLTGGRMYDLSLQFFASTAKAIFSSFTFLFQMRNARRT